MGDLRDKYQKVVLPKLKEELGLKNNLAAPAVVKVVINMGLAEASNKDVQEKAKAQLAQISSQLPKITKAKKAIANFKLQAGDPIGAVATLRGKRAWSFLTNLLHLVLPRMRDFRGLDESKFDKFGNYSFGITEQTIFPQIDYAKVDKTRGLVISIVFKNSNLEKSKRLMELLGFLFRKEVVR